MKTIHDKGTVILPVTCSVKTNCTDTTELVVLKAWSKFPASSGN